MATITNIAGTYLNTMMSNQKTQSDKSARRLSMGEKITRAADGSSEYAISEKMQNLIRGLNQCNLNAETAGDLLQTAEAALHTTTELIKRMKELAVEAANGIYTDADYKALDEAYQQCKDEIDEIAATTNYNGIPLLDGRWARYTEEGIQALEEIKGRGIERGGKLVIDQDGLYEIPQGFTGEIEVKAANVRLKQADTAETLKNVTIKCAAGTNLVVDNLNIENKDTYGKSVIDFQGQGNRLFLVGNNTFKTNLFSDDPEPAAIIHVGQGVELTVEDGGNGKLNLEMKQKNKYMNNVNGGAALGGNKDENCGTIIINGGSIVADVGYSSNVAAIGGGYDDSKTSSYGDGKIVINGGYVEAHGEDGAAIGSGPVYCTAQIDIEINGGIVKAYTDGGYTNYSSAIGGCTQAYGKLIANITLNGGDVTAVIEKTYMHAGGMGDKPEPIGVGAMWKNGCQIDVSNAQYETYYDPGHLSYNGTDWPAGATQYIGHFYFPVPDPTPAPLPVPDPNQNPTPTPTPTPTPDVGKRAWGGLRFQPDTRANFHLVCFIDDMHSDALGLTDTNLRTQAAAQALLSKKDVQGILDTALESVLKEVSRLGSYQSRLEETKANLTTVQENVTSSQSTIRDVDMAEEMTYYKKSQVLLQAAQSMQAQANQQLQGLLQFLK